MIEPKSTNIRSFSTQPTLVKIAVGVTLYLAFVHLEELVIDRYGLWRFLPLYKFGKLCPWDVAALVAITWFLGHGVVRRLRPEAAERPGAPVSVKLAVGLMYLDALVLVRGILGRYGVLAGVPAVAFVALFVAILGGTWWWLARRPNESSFGSQPLLVRVAALLAVSNALLFFAY